MLGIAAILLAAWLWSRPPKPASNGPARILPASVVVTVDRTIGHCPHATFAFDGKITAPRPGMTVAVEWLKPDGFHDLTDGGETGFRRPDRLPEVRVGLRRKPPHNLTLDSSGLKFD